MLLGLVSGGLGSSSITGFGGNSSVGGCSSFLVGAGSSFSLGCDRWFFLPGLVPITGASGGLRSCFLLLPVCSAWSLSTIPWILSVKTGSQVFPAWKPTYLATATCIVVDCLALWVSPCLCCSAWSLFCHVQLGLWLGVVFSSASPIVFIS